MVKALLNSINNIPNTTAQLNSAASDNVSKTDFEKLFDKQQSLASNDKRPEDNTKDDDEESSEKAVSPNDTFAGSVAYDIRQLIAFLDVYKRQVFTPSPEMLALYPALFIIVLVPLVSTCIASVLI